MPSSGPSSPPALLAESCARKGLPPGAIVARLHQSNKVACRPPIDVLASGPAVYCSDEEVGRLEESTTVSAKRRQAMEQNMPKLGSVLMAAVIAAWMGVWVPPAFAKNAFVGVTGQTTCWDPTDLTSPIEIDCSTDAAEGQDGAVQAGVPFP